jgi:acetyltransferase-like isoleucine patch superfamily enzyme
MNLGAHIWTWFRDLLWRIGYGKGPLLMSTLRKRWVVLRHPRATIQFGQHVYLGPGFSLHIPGSGTFIAGPVTEFRRGFRAELVGEGRIVIGAGSVFTYNVLMQCSTSIEIGERCTFGQSTILVDGQHRFRDLDTPMLKQGYDFTPIRIGDDVFVTSKVTVMGDIGQRAVVAANAVVTKPVPPFTVVGGVPARVLEYFGPPGSEPPGLRDARAPGAPA